MGQPRLVNQAAFTGSKSTGLHKEFSVSRGQHKVERFTVIEERIPSRTYFIAVFLCMILYLKEKSPEIPNVLSPVCSVFCGKS